MTNARELTDHIVRGRMAVIAMLLGTTLAVNANAQQTTADSAGIRAVPCTPARTNGAAPSTSAAASGVTTYSAAGETNTAAANGTPTDAGTTAGVAPSETPNNSSTNPDKRFTGLNATNGANGVGADTTTLGKKTPPVAARVPSDSARPGATVCAPTRDHS